MPFLAIFLGALLGLVALGLSFLRALGIRIWTSFFVEFHLTPSIVWIDGSKLDPAFAKWRQVGLLWGRTFVGLLMVLK